MPNADYCLFYFDTDVIIKVEFKQWPLDSEFIEFEYSPKWPFLKMGRTR